MLAQSLVYYHITQIVQKILQNTDKWSCTNSQANEQENIILLVVLSWSSIWSVYLELGETVMTRKSYQMQVRCHGKKLSMGLSLIFIYMVRDCSKFVTAVVSILASLPFFG